MKEVGVLSWVDWVVIIIVFFYIVLAVWEKVWCWFWGIISCSLWVYVFYVFYEFYLDVILQVFYVVMGFVGIYNWCYGGEGSIKAFILCLFWKEYLLYLVGGILLLIVFGYFFDQYIFVVVIYWDVFIMVFLIFVILLFVQCYFDNWVYWVVIDIIYIGLYFSWEVYLFSLLMVVYMVIVVVVWVSW